MHFTFYSTRWPSLYFISLHGLSALVGSRIWNDRGYFRKKGLSFNCCFVLKHICITLKDMLRGAVGSASDSYSVGRPWIWASLKAAVVSLSKKLYPQCRVLVGSRNRFVRIVIWPIIEQYVYQLWSSAIQDVVMWGGVAVIRSSFHSRHSCEIIYFNWPCSWLLMLVN